MGWYLTADTVKPSNMYDSARLGLYTHSGWWTKEPPQLVWTMTGGYGMRESWMWPIYKCNWLCYLQLKLELKLFSNLVDSEGCLRCPAWKQTTSLFLSQSPGQKINAFLAMNSDFLQPSRELCLSSHPNIVHYYESKWEAQCEVHSAEYRLQGVCARVSMNVCICVCQCLSMHTVSGYVCVYFVCMFRVQSGWDSGILHAIAE